MPSELRRVAKALVESRVETFEVAGGGDAARERVERALVDLGTPRALRYAGAWSSVEGRVTYAATFAPDPATPRVLNLIAIVILSLAVGSAWAIATDARALKFLLPLLTIFAVLAMPLVTAALAARREAEESRITRALRAALADVL